MDDIKKLKGKPPEPAIRVYLVYRSGLAPILSIDIESAEETAAGWRSLGQVARIDTYDLVP